MKTATPLLGESRVQYRRGLQLFTLFILVSTTLLLYAGGFTTTIRAGMVFLDWPTSNGSFNPPGWLQNEAMLAEHSHRLLGAWVGTLMIVLVIWVQLVEGRKWVKGLVWAGFGLVVLQGLLGGLRVLANSTHAAITHGFLAQVFLCTLLAIWAVQTRAWFRLREAPKTQVARQFYLGGIWVMLLLFVQLLVAAIMRHYEAGMAIPTFPLMPEGGLLPSDWSFGVTINFAHRGLALLIFILQTAWCWKLAQQVNGNPMARVWAIVALHLLWAQVALGAATVWMGRPPLVTTLHMLNGAFLLGATWLTTLYLARQASNAKTVEASVPDGLPSTPTPTPAS